MPIERETIVERPVERETIVTDRGSNGTGLIVGIAAAVILVLLAFWMLGGLAGGGGGQVNVDLPEVSVSP